MENKTGLDDQMKQRVIGALVLIALVVILLPMLLNFDGEYTVDRRSQIPARPDIVPIEIPLPKPVAEHKGTKNADQMFRFIIAVRKRKIEQGVTSHSGRRLRV